MLFVRFKKSFQAGRNSHTEWAIVDTPEAAQQWKKTRMDAVHRHCTPSFESYSVDVLAKKPMAFFQEMPLEVYLKLTHYLNTRATQL